MSEKLDFLSGAEPSEIAETVETPEVATPIETADGPARGPDGRFVTKPGEPEPAPQAAPPAPPAAAPEQAHAPITALLDEREKRQKAEAQLADLQRQFQQRQAPPPPQAPDRWEDPDGFDAWQQQQMDNRFRQMRAQMSQQMATVQYGPELIQTVRQWAEQKAGADPFFAAQAKDHEHPYEFAVQAYRREQVLSEVTPADLEAFRAWKAVQPAQTPAALTPQSVAPPPRSLASATSAGGAVHIPTGEGQAFDSAFKRN